MLEIEYVLYVDSKRLVWMSKIFVSSIFCGILFTRFRYIFCSNGVKWYKVAMFRIPLSHVVMLALSVKGRFGISI